MIYEKEFIRRLAKKGNPRWTKEGFEKKGWDTGESKWNYEEAREVYDAFIETMMDFLSDGEDINLRGFGKFEIRQSKARASISLDKEGIHIPSHKRVHFTQSKTLRRIVDVDANGGEQ